MTQSQKQYNRDEVACILIHNNMSLTASLLTMIPFKQCVEEFLSLTEQVTSKLRAHDPTRTSSSSSALILSPSAADTNVRMAHTLLLQADDLLKKIGLEARGVEDASVKRDLHGKVSCFSFHLR
jgi:hypothetical protein